MQSLKTYYYNNKSHEPIQYLCPIDKILKIEEWKTLPDHDGFYLVSNLGRVVCLRKSKKRFLGQRLARSGYLRTTIHFNGVRKTIQIHQLVCRCFLNHIPCGMNLVINHIDTDKLNNCAYNFEIVTSRVNSNKKHIKSTSKYVGVDLRKDGKWRARIRHKGLLIHLGVFLSEIKASEAYERKLSEINTTEK